MGNQTNAQGIIMQKEVMQSVALVWLLKENNDRSNQSILSLTKFITSVSYIKRFYNKHFIIIKNIII